MRLIEAIAAANQDGDLPTARDLAEGLGRRLNTVQSHLTQLHRAGRVEIAGRRLPNGIGRPLSRYRVVG